MPTLVTGPATFLPETSIVPVVQECRPATRRSSVDLPQPDGPTMAMNSPSATSMLTSASASVSCSPRR